MREAAAKVLVVVSDARRACAHAAERLWDPDGTLRSRLLQQPYAQSSPLPRRKAGILWPSHLDKSLNIRIVL